MYTQERRRSSTASAYAASVAPEIKKNKTILYKIEKEAKSPRTPRNDFEETCVDIITLPSRHHIPIRLNPRRTCSACFSCVSLGMCSQEWDLANSTSVRKQSLSKNEPCMLLVLSTPAASPNYPFSLQCRCAKPRSLVVPQLDSQLVLPSWQSLLFRPDSRMRSMGN